MSLTAKLTNVNSETTANTDVSLSTLGTISPFSGEDDVNLKESEKEYTAIFILTGHSTGLVNIQFEARSDGYLISSDLTPSSKKIIKSHLKEVQIYGPLNVQPKYVELVLGSEFQITTSGGPMLTDAAIHYEVIKTEYDDEDESENSKNAKKDIVQVNGMGIVNALSGKYKKI